MPTDSASQLTADSAPNSAPKPNYSFPTFPTLNMADSAPFCLLN